jgi:phosphoribosylformylglycinamidine (FGAM) synthase-like enzyme
LIECLVACAESRLLSSAHDVSEGGLAVALVECAATGREPVGLDVDLTPLAGALPPAAALFGEDHGRAVVSAAPERLEPLLAVARRHGVSAQVVGAVGAPAGQVRITVGSSRIERPAQRLRQIYENAIPRRLDGASGTQLARGV